MAPMASSSSTSSPAPSTRDDHEGVGDGDPSVLPLPYRILIEFAYKHVDFHLAELESILECNGIVLLKKGDPRLPLSASQPTPKSPTNLSAATTSSYCQMVPLPSPLSSSTPASSNSSSDAAGVTGKAVVEEEYRPPFVVLEFSSPQPSLGEALVAQCTLVRCAVELWGMGDNVDSCLAAAQDFSSQTHPKWVEPFQAPDKSWKITVHALGSTISLKEQEVIRSRLSFLGFAGPVQLKDPHNEFVFLHEVRLDTTGPAGNRPPSSGSGSASVASSTSSPDPPPTRARVAFLPEDLLACYFGRVLGGIRTTKGRAGLELYTLKKRAYLGPTSMDAELAFVMASLAKVRAGSFVYDPFVGTGSVLVACALKGASHVVGSDIDVRVLRGRGPAENIQSNFAQFNLPRPELLRTDNAIYHRHYRSHVPLYDAIVTDPPYGIRAGARKCGSRLDQPRPVPDDQRDTHIPQTRPYAVSDVMADLLDVAARTLVVGGRLAYIIPSFTDFEPDNDLPRHDCLELVHSCFQPLQGELGRRVVAMQKVAEYDPAQRAAYMSRIWKNGPESAEKVATIREKLHEAAKKKPRYEEKLAVRRQKRKQNRQAKQAAKKRELEEVPDPGLHVAS